MNANASIFSSAKYEPYNLKPNFGINEFREFVSNAASQGASDIVMQAGDRPWVEISGRQIPAMERTLKEGELQQLLASNFGPELNGVIKGAKDADRAMRFVMGDKTYRYRTNIASAQIGDIEDGISITMRVIPESPPPIDALELPDGLRKNLYQPRGMVWVCGPTGAGKTTLLSSHYANISETMPDSKILLYEDPIEYLYAKVKNVGPKIRQMEVGKHIQSMAAGIRNSLRCSPRILGVGEARDRETMDALVTAGVTGHGAYGTMHTESVPESMDRAIQTFPGPEQAAIASRIRGSIKLIVVQLLIPTLDGRRHAVRSWLYFDDEIKNRLGSMPYTDWGAYLRQVVAEKRQDIKTPMEALLGRGLITEQTFRNYVGMEQL